MRHKFLTLTTLLLALAALGALGLSVVGAQGANPSPAITQVTLGLGATAVAPGKVLLLNQRTFAPGADSGAHPAPGPVVLYVESGSVVFTVVKGAAIATPANAKQPTNLASGASLTLAAGGVVTYDAGVIHDVKNISSIPAITLEARLNPAPAAP